jgi:hypothetical protein
MLIRFLCRSPSAARCATAPSFALGYTVTHVIAICVANAVEGIVHAIAVMVCVYFIFITVSI